MSEYRLEQIKGRADLAKRVTRDVEEGVDWLVAEVERLETEGAIAWQKGYEQGFKDGHKTAKGEI